VQPFSQDDSFGSSNTTRSEEDHAIVIAYAGWIRTMAANPLTMEFPAEDAFNLAESGTKSSRPGAFVWGAPPDNGWLFARYLDVIMAGILAPDG